MNMDKPQKIKDEKEKFPKGVILDQYGNPYGGDNTPSVDDSREEFKPVPTIKAEKKIKKESPEDGSKIKTLKIKVRELNEKYLSTTQREDKALLYSQLEQAQREYQEAEEKMDTQPKMSERDRKIARIQALEQVIRDLNEKYLSEMQREQKAILYSQLEQAQKEHRRLEEELDGPETVAKKPTTLNEDLGAEEGKKNPDEPIPVLAKDLISDDGIEKPPVVVVTPEPVPPVIPLTPEPVPPVPNPTPTPNQ